MNISRGKIPSAIKILIYGPEGVGKTTFAAKCPGAVFIDTEGSTRHMDVARFDAPESISDVIDQLNYVLGHPAEIGTVVIDTVDWLEKLIFNAVCVEKKIANIEDIGYGKGYVYAKQKMQQLLELLQLIVNAGVNVCLVCHSMIRKFELPDEMGSYDRYMLKLNEKNIAPIVKEWVDMMLFVNYRTDIVTDSDGKTKKGKGGQKRIMYANHSACWDAKNRFGLPDEMPFDYELIRPILEHGGADRRGGDKETAPETGPVNPPEVRPESREPEKKPAVSVSEKVPAMAKKAKEAERPDEMRSDNPEKDQALEQLWGLMQASGVVDPLILMATVAEKEYYDLTVPVRDYDIDFIRDVLIDAWDQVNNLCQTRIHDLPF